MGRSPSPAHPYQLPVWASDPELAKQNNPILLAIVLVHRLLYDLGQCKHSRAFVGNTGKRRTHFL